MVYQNFFGMDKNLTEACEVTMYSNNITDFALLESNDGVKYNRNYIHSKVLKSSEISLLFLLFRTNLLFTYCSAKILNGCRIVGCVRVCPRWSILVQGVQKSYQSHFKLIFCRQHY